MRVLIIPEDPRKDQYILKPIFERLFASFNKPNTKVVVCTNPSMRGVNDALNEKLLADLGYPQRFGFPVFVVLDDKGKHLHTQNSEYLEDGKGHSKEKVMGFFKDWSPEALDPKTYEKAK